MAVDYGSYSNDITQYGEYAASNSQFGGAESYEMRSRSSAYRVRRALFPDFDDAPTSSPQSLLHELASPALDVKNAIVDLLSVPDESELVGQTLQACISALHCSDPAQIQQAVREILYLSRKEGLLGQLTTNEDLIRGLVNALRNGDPETQRNALAVLASLSTQRAGQLCIFRSGGIAELIRMLRSRDESVRKYAVTTLHNLLLYLETAKEDIIALRGLEELTPLLAEPNPKLQAMVADCIYYIMIERPQCKQVFVDCRGSELLVHLLSSQSNYLKAAYAALRCVASVGCEKELKASLVDLHCLEILHKYIPVVDDPRRRLTLLNAIRNLSDAATSLDTVSGLVADLIVLLQDTHDEATVSCICGILSNLTCNNVKNKQTVTAQNGIRTLLMVVGNFASIEDITEPALCTIRHCTIRHEFANQAQTEVGRVPRGFQIVLCILATRRPPVVKAALGVARNCALQESNMAMLLKECTPAGDDVLGITLEVLEHSGEQLSQDFTAVTDGVSLLELVETAVSLLHQLAREPSVAETIYTNERIMCILFLGMEQIAGPQNVDDSLVMREVMGLLYQLSKSPEGQAAINQHGAVPFITFAYRSPNTAIAYAAVILRSLGLEQQPTVPQNGYQPNSQGSTDTLGSNGRIVQQEYRGAVGWVNEGLEPELYHEFLTTLGEMRHDHIEGQHGNSWFDTDL